ncbi:MAG: hypothetical protein IOD12_18345 [Silvanigrellales bacterium]|nr:hypothetical protein [Silvanigrellales bacterium]
MISSLDSGATTVPDRENSNRVYYSPNEQMPAEAQAVFRWAPDKLHVSVGTERGFLGAASAKANALLLLDYEPGAVFFNRLNAELLEASTDRLDYRQLRLTADADEWRRRAKGEGRLMGLSGAWDWWTDCVRKSEREGCHHFTFFQMSDGEWKKAYERWQTAHPGEKTPFLQPYAGVNYMNDDELYGRLARLAKAGRIGAYRFDFTETSKWRQVTRELTEKGWRLGTFDFSNTWQPEYVGIERTADIADALLPLATPESAFLVTFLGHNWRKAPWVTHTNGKPYFVNPFVYIGFRFSSAFTVAPAARAQCFRNLFAGLPTRWKTYNKYTSTIEPQGQYFASSCGSLERAEP